MPFLNYALVGLFLLTSISAAASAPNACEKAETMWDDRVLPSRYNELPELTSPDLGDLWQLAQTAFAAQAFTREGDELATGREKLIHAHGAEARLLLIPSADANPAYTGIFSTGSACVIGRFSLASKPTEERSIPALALKIFLDGDQPSLNLHLMYSVDGQAGHNFFGETLSNILPPAQTLSTRILTRMFARVSALLHTDDPSRLTLDHLAAQRSDGQRITSPITPYQLLLRPTTTARALMQNARASDDFRVRLATLQPGTVLYELYTLNANERTEQARHWGQLVLASPIVSSRYGDEKLYFRHHAARRSQ